MLSQVLVVRLRDSLIKMGEELSQAVAAEAQQRESSQYYQRRLEELKVDMEELVQREAEASRRCMELVSPVCWLWAGPRQSFCPSKVGLLNVPAWMLGPVLDRQQGDT